MRSAAIRTGSLVSANQLNAAESPVTRNNCGPQQKKGKVRDRRIEGQRRSWNFREKMAPQAGLEPATLRLTAECRYLDSRVLRAGSSGENLVLRDVRQNIVQRLFRQLSFPQQRTVAACATLVIQSHSSSMDITERAQATRTSGIRWLAGPNRQTRPDTQTSQAPFR